jgi:hypothetical protein
MANKKKKGEKPIVKKRSVGRPKKRGRKKVYYKSKKNKQAPKKGFSSSSTYNRIRKLLWENFRDDFASYRAFISNEKDENGKPIKGTSIVSKVFEQCSSLQCLDDDIIEIYRQFRNQNPNDEVPVLPDLYYKKHPYWELITDDWWAGFDNRIWVVTPMLLFDPDYFLGVLGSDKLVDENDQPLQRKFNSRRGDKLIYGKAKRFQEFVNYCNQLQTQGFIQGSDEVPNWRFTGKDDYDDNNVYWSEENQRWEIRIIICDSFEDLESYNFVPSEPDLPIDEDEINRILGRQRPTEEIQTPVVTQTQMPFEEVQGLSKEEIKLREKEIKNKEKEIKLREKEIKNKEKELNLEEAKSKRKDALLEQFIKGEITAKRLENLLKLI